MNYLVEINCCAGSCKIRRRPHGATCGRCGILFPDRPRAWIGVSWRTPTVKGGIMVGLGLRLAANHSIPAFPLPALRAILPRWRGKVRVE